MSDLYTEKLIKRETPASEKGIAVLLAVLTLAALGLAVFRTVFVFPVFVLLLAADVILFPQFNLEYEYLYVNGELDIDKVISKAKRKHAASFHVNQLEMLAPYDSHELDRFKKDTKVKVLDYSSGRKGQGVYGLVVKEEGQKRMLVFEPDDIMLKDIKRRSPRNVRIS